MGKLGHVKEAHDLNGKELDTPSELAGVLKVSTPTVMDYLRRGLIEAEIAIGRVYRFDRDKCLAALRDHSNQKGGTLE